MLFSADAAWPPAALQPSTTQRYLHIAMDCSTIQNSSVTEPTFASGNRGLAKNMACIASRTFSVIDKNEVCYLQEIGHNLR